MARIVGQEQEQQQQRQPDAFRQQLREVVSEALASRIRWVTIKYDLDSVMAIERSSFTHPLDRMDFLKVLGDRHGACQVLELHGRIVGFVLYRIDGPDLHILDLAVAPNCRSRGYGSSLLDRLKMYLDTHARQPLNRITICVPEGSLELQLWLRRRGFVWTKTIAGLNADGSDVYRMEFRSQD